MACYVTISERSQVAGCYDSRGGEKWLLCRCCWEEQDSGRCCGSTVEWASLLLPVAGAELQLQKLNCRGLTGSSALWVV